MAWSYEVLSDLGRGALLASTYFSSSWAVSTVQDQVHREARRAGRAASSKMLSIFKFHYLLLGAEGTRRCSVPCRSGLTLRVPCASSGMNKAEVSLGQLVSEIVSCEIDWNCTSRYWFAFNAIRECLHAVSVVWNITIQRGWADVSLHLV